METLKINTPDYFQADTNEVKRFSTNGVKVVEETQKAVKLEINQIAIGEKIELWVPKSILSIENEGKWYSNYCVPMWFARKNNIEDIG